jgi:hypothetical protein
MAAIVAAVGVGWLAMTATPAGAASSDATLTVVHGIPKTPVDVYVNGKKQLSDFQFKTVTKPLSLPPDTYSIAIRPAGASASSAPILSGSATLAAGENATVVANLDSAGKPALNVFVNPTSAVPPGDARLIVRHVAQASAVDVYAGSSKVISSLTNPNQAALVVPAGTVEAKVTLAGQSAAVIGPVPLDLGAGTTTIVYAIGNPGDGTLTAVTQSYTVGTSAAAAPPTGVQAGTGGAAANHGVPVALALVLALGGLAAAAVSGARLYRRRAR